MCKKDKIGASMSTAIKTRDNMRCRGCGGGFLSPSDLTCDHIMPESAGGKTDAENLQALCWHCNAVKGVAIDPLGWDLQTWAAIDWNDPQAVQAEAKATQARQDEFRARVKDAKDRELLYWQCLRQTWTESKHVWKGRKSPRIAKLAAHNRIKSVKGEKYAEKIRKMVSV